MNIGIDIRTLMSPVRAGVGEYTYELLNAIFAIDKTSQYFLYYNSYSDVSQNIPKWTQENIHYIHTKWPNKLYNASIKIFGVPKVNKVKLDYFFSPNFNFTSLPTDTRRVSMDATRHGFVKPKSILTVHDLSFEFFPEFFSFKQRLWHWAINPKKQCQKATIIITPSENTKRDIVDLFKIPADKIKVIYPGVNCQNNTLLSQDDIRKKYNLPNKFILFLGTVEPRKNIIGLIKAFEKLYSLLPNYHSLIIAGHKGWNDKQIYKKYNASPLKDKIKFIGSVGASDKHILYSLADLFVYSSFYEGFGFPVIEAMAAGTPAITSNRSSLPEITGNAAYLVNPNRPSELAQAMAEMIKNDKLREHFKKLGPEQAKKISWHKAAEEFIGLLK